MIIQILDQKSLFTKSRKKKNNDDDGDGGNGLDNCNSKNDNRDVENGRKRKIVNKKKTTKKGNKIDLLYSSSNNLRNNLSIEQ